MLASSKTLRLGARRAPALGAPQLRTFFSSFKARNDKPGENPTSTLPQKASRMVRSVLYG
ncbi:hypothetical protein EC988_002590, partial [Linderina pennispora]